MWWVNLAWNTEGVQTLRHGLWVAFCGFRFGGADDGRWL